MKTAFELIEANGLTLHGDIEHFAELVYEQAFVDGMQKQMQSSVDKAVNARNYDTSIENQLRQSGIWFDRGRQSAFKETAEKIKSMPWESDTKDSFLVWLKEQSTGA